MVTRKATAVLGDDDSSLDAGERRLRLLQVLQTDGRIDVARVAASFDVARETVRRDLRVLERQGRLERVHGGAVAAQPVAAPVDPRADGEIELGRRLWERLPHAGSMIIGSIQPGRLLADAMLADPPEQDLLTVVTSSLDAAIALSRIPQLQVYNLGGTVRPGTHAQEGHWTIEELRRLRCDVCLLSPDGVDVEGGLSSRSPMAAAVAEAECAAATRVVVLADAQTLGRVALVRFAAAARMSELIMTGPAEPQLVQPIRDLGVDTVCLDRPEDWVPEP